MPRPPRYIPQALPGWTPTTQSNRSTMAPKLLAGLLLATVVTVGLGYLGVLERPNGFLAVPITCALLIVLRNIWADGRWRAVGRALLAGAAIAGLALVLVGSTPSPPQVKAPLKAPVQVDAAQADLLEQARNIWAEAWQTAIAQGGADPNAKKEAQ